MRKRTKSKKAACPLCKPYKRNGELRWKQKEFHALREFEQQKNMLLKDLPTAG